MKVRTKLILLLLLLGIIFSVGWYFFQTFEDKRMLIMLQEEIKDKTFAFDSLMKLKGESLATLAYDYTYWDEMVTFVRKNDMVWAEGNMNDSTLKTYHADAIWVYNTDFSEVYSIKSQNAASLEEFPVPAAIKEVLLKKRLCYFFINTPAGLMEIRGATIHPTVDVERATTPQGYFFCGRLWGKEYIGELEKLMEGIIEIKATKPVVLDSKTLLKINTITFSREFLGWEGKPVAYLSFRAKSQELIRYKIFSLNAAAILIGFFICVLIFMRISLGFLVSVPLSMISKVLKTEKVTDSPSLEKDSSEFGDIWRLITKFFKQKKDLEASRRLIKNVAEDLADSKEILEYQNRTLTEVNKELDDFTYIVSHDLKEPLRSIDAYSKFIVDDYRDKLGEEGKHYLERIRANAERMKRLIEDLLEISRLKKKGSIFEEVGIADIIVEVKARLEYAIKEKGVEIIIKDKLPRIFCDRVRLTEVFLNLISNAIKFNDKQKPVIEIGCNDTEEFYEFYVKDNGIGIKEEYFDKIFEIFQRLGRREDNEGTGAGLTIVKKIVQLHKGNIWLESKPQEGAVFYFTIPKDKNIILGKKLIGEILLEKKMVTEEDLKKALEDQEMMGRPKKGGDNGGNTQNDQNTIG